MSVGRGLVRVVGAAATCMLVACGGVRAPHPPTIAFLGDSITFGIVRGSRGRQPAEVDAAGGYPGRLARRLGDRARVLNRGIGGATTTFWLAAPESKLGQAMWALIERAPWFEPGLVPRGESVAVAALSSAHPDVVVLLLGVNDIYWQRREGDAGVATALEGIPRLARQLGAVARVVLVATPLPNHRDPPEQVAAFTAGLHERFPDALPVGERFAALHWDALLGDFVHPNSEGYERLAAIFESLLVERGLVAPAAR